MNLCRTWLQAQRRQTAGTATLGSLVKLTQNSLKLQLSSRDESTNGQLLPLPDLTTVIKVFSPTVSGQFLRSEDESADERLRTEQNESEKLIFWLRLIFAQLRQTSQHIIQQISTFSCL